METRGRKYQRDVGPGPTHSTSSHPSPDAGSTPVGMEGGIKLPRGAVVMFVSLLLDLLAFTMILPLLPALLDYYGNVGEDGLYTLLTNSVHGFRELVGAPNTPRWNSVLFGGLIGSLFSVLQFISNPLLGAASDVYGRRPVMLISLLGISLSHLMWVFSGNFTIFVLARIVGGITKGNISLSTAVMTDLLPPEKRGKGMALIGVAFSLGFLIGPMIGAGFASQVRLHANESGAFFVAPALFALVLSIIDVVFVYAAFKETLPKEKRAPSLGSGIQDALYLINPVSLFRFSAVKNIKPEEHAAMCRVGLVYFLYLFIYSGLEFTLTFLTHNRFEYNSMRQGRMFFMIGSIMILVQGGYVRRLQQGSEKELVLKGMAVLIPAFIIIGVSYIESFMYLGLILFAFASATVVPCMTTLMSSFGTPKQKGTILGIFRSLGALARALGPVFISTVYWSGGSVVSYIIGGLLVIIPLLMFKTTKITHSHTD